MMVSVLDVSLTVFAVLNVVFVLVGFDFSGCGFGFGLGGNLSGFRVGDWFVGLVGEVEGTECADVDKVEEEGDQDVVGLEHQQVHDV